jgi:serine/threonine protein phosphatase PrpC
MAVVAGRSYPRLGALHTKSASAALAVGTTAGALLKWTPPLDPNEDVGAVVRGPRADLLVVADAHFGCEASELAVGHVLAALGDDPPPADLSPESLTALVFGTGIAVQHGTSLPECPHPDSRTTLALALVTPDAVQWATFGDSYVLTVHEGVAARLDTPRNAYLGHAFGVEEITALMSSGRAERRPGEAVVLASDGLESIEPVLPEMAAFVSHSIDHAYGAGLVVEGILELALQYQTADATTVAVAI